MSNVVKFPEPEPVEFCTVCLDESACDQAGRCLYEAEEACAAGEKAEVKRLPGNRSRRGSDGSREA